MYSLLVLIVTRVPSSQSTYYSCKSDLLVTHDFNEYLGVLGVRLLFTSVITVIYIHFIRTLIIQPLQTLLDKPTYQLHARVLVVYLFSMSYSDFCTAPYLLLHACYRMRILL